MADIVDEILEMLFETQMEKRTVVISFAESAITKILEENPEIPALLLLYDAWTVDSEENIRDLISFKVDFLTTNYLERAIRIKREMLGM